MGHTLTRTERAGTLCSHRYDDCGTRLGLSPTSALQHVQYVTVLAHCDPRKRETAAYTARLDDQHLNCRDQQAQL